MRFASLVFASMLAAPLASNAADYDWLNRPLAERNNQRVIGAAPSLVNVFPDQPPPIQDISAELSLSAARNESESAQIVLVAGDQPLRVTAISVGDLRRGASALPADCIEVRLVGYVDVQKPSWRGTKRIGLHPDPLMRFRPFTCPAGQARSLWVTVRVPAETPAGEYRGAITLFEDDRVVHEVPMAIRVFDFELPPEPRLHTSYWTHFSGTYDVESEPQILEGMIRMFGAYRTSTSVAQPGDVVFYLEEDKSITCDWTRIRRRLELALESGFRTLNVGPGSQGVHGDAAIQDVRRIIDRSTGKPVSPDVAASLSPEKMAAAYLVPLADWLAERGVLDRAYIQVLDEEIQQDRWKQQFLPVVERFRRVEPRIAILSVLGLHPSTQGWFDIYAPHTAFYDKVTYERVRRGESLAGAKTLPAEVTASSTGGWGNPSFYKYRPLDAYDGAEYTKWIPGEKPTEAKPQWLRFEFDHPTEIDGLALTPYGNIDEEVQWRLEGSLDGETFEPVALKPRGKTHEYSIAPHPWKALRIVWTRGERAFIASAQQPLPPPETLTVGLREVEFLLKGQEREASRPRKQVRPARMMWEYNVDADFPGVAVDNDLIEPRLIGWLSWSRGLEGYLNYGGGQWSLFKAPRMTDAEAWIYPAPSNGGAAITYAGADEVLPSIRLARFRDGIDDYDYLALLHERNPKFGLFTELDRRGLEVCRTPEALMSNRARIASQLER